MKSKQVLVWFSIVSVILVLFGVLFAFFGLAILPVQRDVLLQWESALYGAIMMGWGTTLFFVGRLAFQRNDPDLMKNLLYGLIVWLVVEAIFSASLGVWFNVAVDIGVLALFSQYSIDSKHSKIERVDTRTLNSLEALDVLCSV